MSVFLTLFKKDLTHELRLKETISLLLGLVLLLAVVVSFGVNSAFLDEKNTAKIFPFTIWILFIFSGTAALSKSFDYELSERALQGLLLTGVLPELVYLAKVLSNFILALICAGLSYLTLLLLLNVPALPAPAMLAIMCGVTLGYAALSTLISPIANSSRLKHLLLPLLLIPLLFPLIFAALELTAELQANASLDLASGWTSLLLFVDVLYLLLGISLFKFCIKE